MWTFINVLYFRFRGNISDLNDDMFKTIYYFFLRSWYLCLANLHILIWFTLSSLESKVCKLKKKKKKSFIFQARIMSFDFLWEQILHHGVCVLLSIFDDSILMRKVIAKKTFYNTYCKHLSSCFWLFILEVHE